MNLRDHKTYIDELLERVQVDRLSPDEASTLLWAILDNFNRAYLAATDTYKDDSLILQRRRTIRPPVPAEQVVWSASGEMIAPDGTRTPIKNVTLRMRLSDDGRPAAWSSDNITPPLFTQKIPAADARLIKSNEGPMPDHTLITIVRRNYKMRTSDYLKVVRDVMRALDQDQVPFVKAENNKRTAMYFYHAAAAPVSDHFKPDYTCCLVCGEPITWSKGGQRWRHFGHPEIDHPAEGELNPPIDVPVPEVGDCQRYPTASASSTLYCYKCKGAVTFVEVSAIGHWAHLNPAQQKDHKVDLTGRSDLDDRTCMKCDQPIFYGAHPSGGVGWVHYGLTEPSHVAVEEIRTGESNIDDIETESSYQERHGNEPVNDQSVSEAATDLSPLVNTLKDRHLIVSEAQSASVGRLIDRLKEDPHDTGNHEEINDVLRGDDPEESDNVDLERLDATPAKPEIHISAGGVTPGAYTLWNTATPSDIHKSHKDGQTERA